jgi:3-phenylpropionate/trans-cinnamate dioxygenase ferredoxin subunit
MTRFFVGKASDIPHGKIIHLMIDEKKDILVANMGGKYYAVSNICSHEGARLHEGRLTGKELICPWHGAKWDVTTGKLILFPENLKSLRSFKVSIENDSVYVEG